MENNNQNLLTTSLQSLGLSDFDISLYLAILKKGTATVSYLARTLRVERPTIYSALARLENHALIPAHKAAYVRDITAEPPSRILSLLEKHKTNLDQTQAELKKALPDFMAEFAAKSKLSAFRLFEGKEQFLTVFEEALREAKDEILFYGDANTFIQFEGVDYEASWRKRRIRRKILNRILVLKDKATLELKKTDKQELRQTRLLPENAYFQSSFMLYGYKTLLWNPVAARAIVIDDPIITEMFRQTFELVWRNAK